MRTYLQNFLIGTKINTNQAYKNAKLTFSNLYIRQSIQGLIILDDIFPHLLSSFRIAEFNTYLRNFPESHVYSTCASFQLINERRSYKDVLSEYGSYYPQNINRISKFSFLRTMGSSLAYIVFLNNGYYFINFLEKRKTPFVFTLYPGGGFQINGKSSDDKLRRLCSSPYLHQIIATQKITYDYLITKKVCDKNKVSFIYGGVLPSVLLQSMKVKKKYYRHDKTTFDICFVANKYMPGGVDKGFDRFIETARKLSNSYTDMVFHIVGSFSKNDIDMLNVPNIIFHGVQFTSFFPRFYAKMDLILSPNIPYVLAPGAFDGFPTGACVEAGFCGVAVFCTDILYQNIYFKDGVDIVVIQKDIDQIFERISYYYENIDQLYQLSERGQEKFIKIFGFEAQMGPRLEIISRYLDEC